MNDMTFSTGRGPVTISSLEIARRTGKRHADVMRDIRGMLEQLQINERNFASVYLDAKNEQRPCFNLPKREALILASGYDVVLRASLVDAIEEMERSQYQAPSSEFVIPKTMSEALRLAADLSDKVEQQTVLIQDMTPKADFHDQVAAAVNAQTFMDVAKVMNTGRTRFTRWLRERKFMMENNRPYQQYLDAGHFRCVEKKRKDPNTGETFTYTQTLITGKGITYLQKKWA